MTTLVLFDLDNTLVDRESAFADWAQDFMVKYGLSAEAWKEIKFLDADGTRSKIDFFSDVRVRFGIANEVQNLIDDYYHTYPEYFSVEPQTIEAIRLLRLSGFKVAVVTNGSSWQMRKFEVTKLTHEFDAICVSELVGMSKPNSKIFEEAARLCGVPLDGWMVGDSDIVDIEGGRLAGLRTVWISRGRDWNPSLHLPDAITDSVASAVGVIMSEPGTI